jgi:NitT/TauT family transport system ATP-binding protein
MLRRALLARSTIYHPKMLLMDEPFAALDAQLRAQMHTQLLEEVNRTGQTVLFITHDLYEAVLLSDRVIVLGGSPAHPIREFTVPFGRERDLATLRFEPEFAVLERRVHDALNHARQMSASETEVMA